MRDIVIVGRTQPSVAQGIRVAADLSVACGARLILAPVPAGLPLPGQVDWGCLSDQLFAAPRARSPFGSLRDPVRLDGEAHAAPGSVAECWDDGETGSFASLIGRINRNRPDLLIACDAKLARALEDDTNAPVWQVRHRRRDCPWSLRRHIRCRTQGARATQWAKLLADSMNARLDLTPRLGHADVTVLTRGLRSTLLGAVAAWDGPVVVV